MKNTFSVLLILIAAANTEAQPLPVRVGYTILASAMSPLWVAKESGLFERHGVQSGAI